MRQEVAVAENNNPEARSDTSGRVNEDQETREIVPRVPGLLGRLSLAVIGAIVATAVFAAVAREANVGHTQRVDDAVRHWFIKRQTPPLMALLNGLSLLASTGALVTLALLSVGTAWRRPALRPEALSMIVAVTGGQGLVLLLKEVFHRPRPDPLFAHLGYSFPSGHALLSVTIYGMLAYRFAERASHRRWVWPAAGAVIVLVSSSRVILGVHYLSDVLGGLAAGAPWLWGCLALPRALGLIRTEQEASE